MVDHAVSCPVATVFYGSKTHVRRTCSKLSDERDNLEQELNIFSIQFAIWQMHYKYFYNMQYRYEATSQNVIILVALIIT